MSPKDYKIRMFASGAVKHCWMCKCVLTPGSATVDHLVPIKWGGKDKQSNYRLACRSCNSSRGNSHLTKDQIRAAKGRARPKGNAEKFALLAGIAPCRKPK